jgi:translation initiation factor 1
VKRPNPAAAPSPSAREQLQSPFAGLEGLRKSLPPGPSPATPGDKPPPKAVIRLERKGRGGKEVTVVEQLGLEPPDLALWLRELKQSLGCGGAVEESALVFQGDQRKRLKAALLARGVRRIQGV